MRNILWHLLLASALLLSGFTPASAQAPAIMPSATAPNHADAKTWQITPSAQYSNLTWQGRQLGLFEGGVQVGGETHPSLGAYLRSSTGHGRSSLNTYDAHGVRFTGTLPLFTERSGRPAATLFVDYLHDRAVLKEQSPTSHSTAWSRASSTGIGLQAELHRGSTCWQGKAAGYASGVDGEHLADTLLVGGAVDVPLIRSIRGTLALTGFREDFEGHRITMEVTGGVTLLSSERGSLKLGGSYFPRGIPLGGTPFSTAAGIGVINGSSTAAQLRTEAMGYLTVAGELHF
jgi:hypothetical protein